MRTLAKSQTCEVYCISGYGHSGCSPAQVSHHCALIVARKCQCQKVLCYLKKTFSHIILPLYGKNYSV